jgi:hypothetical protein
MQRGYELQLRVIEGSVACRASASQLYHVEIAVDGIQSDEDKTALVEQIGGKISWNKQVVKSFKTLETRTPIIISLTLYKKRTFQTGFRVVGSAHIPLMDLARILNKPAVTGKMVLNTKSHNIVSSHLVLQFQLRSTDADPHHDCRPVSPTSLPTIFTAASTPTSRGDSPHYAEVVRPVANKADVDLTAERRDEIKEGSLDMYIMVAIIVLSMGVWTVIQVLA